MNVTDNASVDTTSASGKHWRAVTAAGYFATGVSLFAASAMDHPYHTALFSVGIVFFVVGAVLAVRTYQKTRESD
ncbi:MAG: hypothetical protein H6822_26330 [Planctomycetaceae bacterium]|nr:hypothetical protein [Planctomycetales bacterium]MCB9925696.1 hypothetical protein [Planctomycetaceae bacterium]